MDTQDIKQVVKETYTEVLKSKGGCCQPTCCSPGPETAFSEAYTHVPGYVPEADYGLGCGIPTEVARIEPGDTVLDLGAGAGNDAFVARQLVGEAGRVIGLDMTEAMVAQARRNQAKLGYENVEFILGDIEAIPLPDACVDVVVSNCVLNLVPDKDQAYAEIHRVLKPGGHFSNARRITCAFDLIFCTNAASEKASLGPPSSVFLPCLRTKPLRKIGKLFFSRYLAFLIL